MATWTQSFYRSFFSNSNARGAWRGHLFGDEAAEVVIYREDLLLPGSHAREFCIRQPEFGREVTVKLHR